MLPVCRMQSPPFDASLLSEDDLERMPSSDAEDSEWIIIDENTHEDASNTLHIHILDTLCDTVDETMSARPTQDSDSKDDVLSNQVMQPPHQKNKIVTSTRRKGKAKHA